MIPSQTQRKEQTWVGGAGKKDSPPPYHRFCAQNADGLCFCFSLRVFRQLSSDTDKRRNRPDYVHITNIIVII